MADKFYIITTFIFCALNLVSYFLWAYIFHLWVTIGLGVLLVILITNYYCTS